MIKQLLNAVQFSQWSWLVPWLFALSVVVFIGSIIGVWFVLIRLPENYLTRDREPVPNGPHRPLGQLARKITLNVVGVVFLLAGIVMLLTPGQGILSIFVGITLTDFPGKRKLIRKLLARPKVLRTINKLRKRSNKPPIKDFATPAETENSAIQN